MNVIKKFMELNFSILSVFFFIFSLFVIFSMFKEWMLITKIIIFYLLNSLLSGILIMKFNIQIEKILNITRWTNSNTYNFYSFFNSSCINTYGYWKWKI